MNAPIVFNILAIFVLLFGVYLFKRRGEWLAAYLCGVLATIGGGLLGAVAALEMLR